jgi:flagellar biogenesis protein FliO
MTNGFPLGLVLWFVTFVVIIVAIWYMVRRFNQLQREFRQITGLLIANGWDLETGRQVNVPKNDPHIRPFDGE